MTEVVSGITLKDLEQLEGYHEEATKSPYELKRLRNADHLLILYTSGKLVIQGKNNPFGSSLTSSTKQTPQTIPELSSCIGSDETLKGDTFGGIIVCAAYFSQDEVDLKDSKTYSDDQIRALAPSLLETYPDRFSSKILSPQQYNELFSKLQNQTRVLNVLHQEVGLQLKKRFDAKHVVDKYPGCKVGDYQVEKGESHFRSIAAASIIARYYGILQFDELSAKAGFLLPKGSTHVQEAVQNIKAEQLDIAKFGKLHFSTITPR